MQPNQNNAEQEQLNKYAKFYFVPCETKGKVDWDLVDGSSDFSVIPTNSKGIVQIEIGDLRDIIKVVVAEADRLARIDELEYLDGSIINDPVITMRLEMLTTPEDKSNV